MNVIELRRKRAELLQQIRTMADQAERENRGFTGEERQTEATIDAEIGRIEAQLKGLETQERMMGGNPSGGPHKPMPDGSQGAYGRSRYQGQQLAHQLNGGTEYRFWGNEGASDQRSLFNRYLVYGAKGLDASEYRALAADAGPLGGYLLAPMQIASEFVQGINDETFALRLARVYTVDSAQSLGIPTLDTDVADADWTSELATGSEDTAMRIGQRDLHPHPLAKRIKVSNKLLRLSTLNPDQIVIQRLGYKFAVSLERAFMTGSGANQPLGIFTPSADGIDTSRDSVADNAATAVTGDGLINALHHIKPQYRRRASWIFHDDCVKQIRKLKDQVSGDYLWQPGLQAGQPDRLLGLPVYSSQYAPNTFTASQYVGVVGDFQFYAFAQALSLTVQVLDQLYAEENSVGFIGRMEIDGMPVIAEAFARVKLAAE